jgi:hypothetical protein
MLYLISLKKLAHTVLHCMVYEKWDAGGRGMNDRDEFHIIVGILLLGGWWLRVRVLVRYSDPGQRTQPSEKVGN